MGDSQSMVAVGEEAGMKLSRCNERLSAKTIPTEKSLLTLWVD